MALTLTSFHTFAKSAVSEHTSAASKHSALAATNSTVVSAKVGSAVVAIPLVVAGAIGHVSLKTGEFLLDQTNTQKPLQVSDKTITATPSPHQAMADK